MEQKKRTLGDLLHAINIFNEDYDVTVDGNGSIAVCPPVKLTPKAHEEFKEALAAPLMDDDRFCVSGETEKQDVMAWKLLVMLAGFCEDWKYAELFEGNDAEEL